MGSKLFKNAANRGGLKTNHSISHPEERTSKRRKIDSHQTSRMTSTSPIELSSDEDDGYKKKLDTGSKVYSSRQAMILDAERYTNPRRSPLKEVYETGELDELAGEEEQFTYEARKERLAREQVAVPKPPPRPLRNGHSHDSPSHQRSTPNALRDVSDSRGPHLKAGSRNFDEVHSEDVLMEGSEMPGQEPPHTVSNTKLAARMLEADKGTFKAPKQNANTAASRAKVNRRKSIEPDTRNFKLKQLQYGTLPKDYTYAITIHRESKLLTIHPQDQIMGDSITQAVVLTRVHKIIHGHNGCTMVMLHMSQVQNALDNKIYLELQSDKEVFDFVTLVQHLAGADPTVFTKDESWLNNAFQVHGQTRSSKPTISAGIFGRQSARLQQNDLHSSNHEAGGAASSVDSRLLYKDRLETTDSNVMMKSGSASVPATIITGKDRSGQARQTNDSDSHAGRPSTISRFFATRNSPARQTRATSKASLNLVDDEDDLSKAPKIKHTEMITAWKKSLTYPKTGKRRETVDFQDLDRLEEEEFLNDNLVGFFLRYLENHMEQSKPEVAKKVYFYNSYFYERLTQKDKRTIDYPAVERWTRNINIFNRDFVVVPVNENYHWYLAIICNLPFLKNKNDCETAEDEEIVIINPVDMNTAPNDEDLENEAATELADEPNGETSSQLQQMSLGDVSRKQMVDQVTPLVTSDVKTPTTPKAKPRPGRRKSNRRSLPKIDPQKPCIITLDSLGGLHTNSRAALKDYIIAEGKARQNLRLSRDSIPGINAQGLPGQKNFSDCGLFLCAYMEKFAMDPYGFVREILQREGKESDWQMDSSEELRSRLRDMISELHREQEGEPSQLPIPEVGKILLRTLRKPSPVQESEGLLELDGQVETVSSGDEAAEQQIHEELARESESPRMTRSQHLMSAYEAINGPKKPVIHEAPIEIPDDSPSEPGLRHNGKQSQTSEISDDLIHHDAQLVDLRKERKASSKAPTRRAPKPTSESPRQKRSDSVTTQFLSNDSYDADLLSGIHAYASNHVPGEFPVDEVPETQSQEREPEKHGEQEILAGL